ncbi:MAG: transporter substrate-binding domain-containing protein [Acidobacteriota bacterium]
MENKPNLDRRNFLKTALGLGGAAAVAGAIVQGGSVREAYGQLLKSGIREDSVLAKMKKTGKLKVGYSQTKPNFYLDAKTNKLRGIFYDVTEFLGKETEVEIEYQEVLWANATVGLRKGDFDVFVSSLTYTLPRALVINYVGPLHHKGFVAVAHRDNKNRFRTADDFNHSNVIFSVNVGSASENIIKERFPKAKIIHVSGQIVLAAEPVRTKQAHLYVMGDLDAEVFAGSNEWAYAVDPEHPYRLLPNTWAIRYDDPEWKFFIDMFADRMLSTGFMKQRFDFYKKELIKGT